MWGPSNKRSGLVLTIGLLILTISACKPSEPPPTEAPTEPLATEVPVEDPLAILAEQIRQGEVDVGDEAGMAPGQRFHNIHSKTIELGCEKCHQQDMSAVEMVFYDQDTSKIAPAPVYRDVCLECHEEGPAMMFYGGASK